jgi:hypothetical protein
MLEQENKIKSIIATIVSPFATAAMVLLILLSLLEYFRRGFVSLFLDFRLLAAIALVLWLVAAATEERPRRRRLALVLPTLALLTAIPILYKMTAPFGRLGFVTLIAGIAAIVVIFLSLIKE